MYDPSIRQDIEDSEFMSVYNQDLYDIPEQGIEYSDGAEQSDFFFEGAEYSQNHKKQMSPNFDYSGTRSYGEFVTDQNGS